MAADVINSIISFRIFSTLKHLSFFKTKPVSHSIKGLLTLQLFKTISGVCSKNKVEGMYKKVS